MDFVKDRLNQLFRGKEAWQVARDTALGLTAVYYGGKLVSFVQEEGLHGLKAAVGQAVFNVVSKVPGASGQIDAQMRTAASQIENMMLSATSEEISHATLPKSGKSKAELAELMERWGQAEHKLWGSGKISGAVYHGGTELQEVTTDAYRHFAYDNPLHPEIFPYVRKMEAEVIRMVLNMFHGDDASCGSLTSGGTESIILALKTYRERGRARGITKPELIMCKTAHAAFDKGCHMLGIKLIKIGTTADCRLDVAQLRAKLSPNTVAIVGSSPCYPQGTIDPLSELSAIALEKDIGLHVDCCLGSLLLPFAEKLGYKLPVFDFRLPGVTSISADTHKYGYSPKGTSVIMYRDQELRRYQYFFCADWTGGIYATPTIAGSRAGGLSAATWAAMMFMGEEGYTRCAERIMQSAQLIITAVRDTEGLEVMGEPLLSVVAFKTDDSPLGKTLNIYNICDAMGKRGWHLNTLQSPASAHICCTYAVRDMAERFGEDLSWAVNETQQNKDQYKDGTTAALYGMSEAIPGCSVVTNVMGMFLDGLTVTKTGELSKNL